MYIRMRTAVKSYWEVEITKGVIVGLGFTSTDTYQSSLNRNKSCVSDYFKKQKI